MMKARLAAWAVAATLASAGVAHAAPVAQRQEPQVAAAPQGTPAGAAHQAVAQKSATDPVQPTAAAGVRDDGAPVAGGAAEAAASIVSTPVPQQVRTAERAVKSGSPLHSYLLSAGEYVLQVGTLSDQYTAPSKIKDVPLPGAIWLFGSALLAFLGISSRRKL